jgi:hypothetical protein
MNSQQFIVKKGETTDIVVRPRMKTDDQGASSKQTIQLWLTKQAVSNEATGSGSVRGRGLQSSNNLVANDGAGGSTVTSGEVFIGTNTPSNTNSDIIGNPNHSALAKYASITNANPDADNTNVPTGTAPIGQFKFTAATNTNSLNGLNKATLSGVIFTVNATNVDLDGSLFKFYNKADTSTKSTCSMLGSTSSSGSLTVECKGLKASTVDVTLDSGESTTYVLEGSVTNPKANASNTSTLQVSIDTFTTMSTNSFGSSASHIHWLDEDTSSTSFYWVEFPDTVVKSTSYKS